MDIITTFLNKVIDEEVYIEELECFETFDRESHVFVLKKVLYGHKCNTLLPHLPMYLTNWGKHVLRGYYD